MSVTVHRPAKGRILLGDSSLATYLLGGGHWTVYLQYMLGLRALHYEVALIELLPSSGDRSRDEAVIAGFFGRMKEYGLEDACIVLVLPELDKEQHLEQAQVYGRNARQVRDLITGADLLWNLCAAVRPPLLSLSRCAVLIDLDPAYLQLSATEYDLGLQAHDRFLTLGHGLGCDDRHGPDLGIRWRTFRPFVYLPFWPYTADPGSGSPFTSVTQWTWSWVSWQGVALSTSKRDAYLRYLDLPRHVPVPLQLAVNIDADDVTGDRELLLEHGWQLVHPHDVAATPDLYRRYIQSSRAEFLCPKPIFRDLETGWISDRSLAYLATGRPVMAEETGYSAFTPTGEGLLSFRTLDEAIGGIQRINDDYGRHSIAARELVEAYFDSAACLEEMVTLCAS